MSSTTDLTPIKVDIWSDVQCPWCYIGKRKFEAGVKTFGRPVEIEYHSYELSPDTPVDFEGSPIDYLSQRKGLPVDQVHEMLERVTGVAAEVGLDYHYDLVHQTNTRKAHEVLHYAKAHGKQIEMKERLLKAYFIEGGHVGKLEQLADFAAEIGLDREDVLRSLEAGEYAADVEADVQQAQAYGIQGVPFFVIDGKYGISGAQPAEAFAGALEQALSER
jgi:predicted DsbA family dithiol-disulfide isomerase